jgi:hypothetical protein
MHFLHMYEYGKLKTVKVIYWRGMEEDKEYWRGWPNHGFLHAHMEISQQNLLYRNHVLIKSLWEKTNLSTSIFPFFWDSVLVYNPSWNLTHGLFCHRFCQSGFFLLLLFGLAFWCLAYINYNLVRQWLFRKGKI